MVTFTHINLSQISKVAIEAPLASSINSCNLDNLRCCNAYHNALSLHLCIRGGKNALDASAPYSVEQCAVLGGRRVSFPVAKSRRCRLYAAIRYYSERGDAATESTF